MVIWPEMMRLLATTFSVLLIVVYTCYGLPCTEKNNCGCFQNRCWTYVGNPPVPNGDWCYTQELGVSKPTKKWITCQKHGDCDTAMTCGSSVRYRGVETNVKDEDVILECPEGWPRNRNRCYFVGNKFTGLSWYTASAFCHAIKARLAEIRDQGDLDVITRAVKSANWTQGPWIGVIRPFPDNQRWIPASGGVAPTADFHQKVNQLTAANNNGFCGGFSQRGDSFGFYSCGSENGSPFCELEVPA